MIGRVIGSLAALALFYAWLFALALGPRVPREDVDPNGMSEAWRRSHGLRSYSK